MEADYQPESEGALDVHKPFTKSERIQQLAEIDSDITHLLTHTGQAVQFLSPSMPGSTNGNSSAADGDPAGAPEASGAPSELNPQERLESFRATMNAFMKTLHSVDVRLKRQIWGLEEAGIITLNNATDRLVEGPTSTGLGAGRGVGGSGESGNDGATSGGAGAGAAVPAGPVKSSLEPNGVGKIGDLDVGWLNSRSHKVEREMESELWAGARKHLEAIVEGRVQAGGTSLGLGRSGRDGPAEKSERMED